MTTIAVAGIHGYARSGANAILMQPGDSIRLVAVGCPEPEKHADRVAELQARGVVVYDSFDQVLRRDDVDAVWLPLPIHDASVVYGEIA